VRSRLLPSYAAAQAALILGSIFVPREGWPHAIWEVVVGWAGAAFVLVGARRFRPRGVAIWYVIGAGIFLNTSGLIVDSILIRVFAVTESPSIADLFWLSLYPGLITGLSSFVYRQTLGEDLDPMLLRTGACAVVSVILGIFAWELIIWPHNDHRITLIWRMVVAAYPLADLILIALVLRLLMGGAARNRAFVLIAVSVLGFLIADIGWAVILRSGTQPTPGVQHLLEFCSMGGQALIGAAALHPAMAAIAPAPPGPPRRLGGLGWTALAVLVLTSPVVLVAHATLDYFWLAGGL
jgi:hypothetical protein